MSAHNTVPMAAFEIQRVEHEVIGCIRSDIVTTMNATRELIIGAPSTVPRITHSTDNGSNIAAATPLYQNIHHLDVLMSVGFQMKGAVFFWKAILAGYPNASNNPHRVLLRSSDAALCQAAMAGLYASVLVKAYRHFGGYNHVHTYIPCKS